MCRKSFLSTFCYQTKSNVYTQDEEHHTHNSPTTLSIPDAVVQSGPSPGDEDGMDRKLEWWFLLCQLDEQLRDQSHVTKTVCRPSPVQLVSLETRGHN